jgi:hypothetical protein
MQRRKDAEKNSILRVSAGKIGEAVKKSRSTTESTEGTEKKRE